MPRGNPQRCSCQIDKPANYNRQVRHPLGKVTLNADYANRLIPLLKRQPYIAEAKIWQGEPVEFNLNNFRLSGFDFGTGDIARYYRHIFACQPRTWEPWLTVDPDLAYAGLILLNRTQRYRNPNIDYSFLSAYASRLIFMGLPEEYREWRAAYHVNVPHYQPRDFLEAAKAIVSCRLFVGNQSSCFQIAEALKVQRIVEVSQQAPNVIPNGPGGFEAISQYMIEKLVADLH